MDWIIDEVTELFQYRYAYIQDVYCNKNKFVYLYKDTVNDDYVIIKAMKDECLDLSYEYNVGMKLNSFHKHYLVKTLDYASNEELSCIVLEFVEGQILTEFMTQLTHTEEIKNLFKLTALTSAEFNELGCTHYDLHSSNIIVTTADDYYMTSFHVGGKELGLMTKYRVKFIDFGFTHFPGLRGNCIIDETSIYNGIVPSCFDNMYDLCTITSCFSDILQLPLTHVHDIMEDNLFLPPRRNFAYIPGEVYGTTTGRERTYLGDELYGTKWMFAKWKGIILDSFTISKSYPPTKPSREMNQFQISCCANNYKRVLLSRRKHTGIDLLNALFVDLNSLGGVTNFETENLDNF